MKTGIAQGARLADMSNQNVRLEREARDAERQSGDSSVQLDGSVAPHDASTGPRPLPTPGTPPAPAPLRKIAVEEHILDPVNTSTDFPALAASGGLEASFYEVVLRRLRDFTSIRLPEMDTAGIEVSVLSLTAPGIEGIRDLTMAVAGGLDPGCTPQHPERH